MSASAAASLDAAVKRGEDHDATAEPKDVDNSRYTRLTEDETSLL